jgi:hypothetical protein
VEGLPFHRTYFQHATLKKALLNTISSPKVPLQQALAAGGCVGARHNRVPRATDLPLHLGHAVSLATRHPPRRAGAGYGPRGGPRRGGLELCAPAAVQGGRDALDRRDAGAPAFEPRGAQRAGQVR